MKFVCCFLCVLCGASILLSDDHNMSVDGEGDSTCYALFPLQIGNLWEYWDNDSYAGQTMVMTDTIPNNSLKYSVLEGPIVFGFYRQEGDKVFRYYPQYNSEELFFDFSKMEGDTISVTVHDGVTITTTLERKYVVTVYGRELNQWKFFREFTPTTYYEAYYVSDSMGIVLFEVEPAQQWFLSGAVIDGIQYGTVTKVREETDNIPTTSELFSFPNPFNSITTIQFSLPSTDIVTLTIFNSLGSKVKEIYVGPLPSGEHSFIWNGSDNSGKTVASGAYICLLIQKNNIAINRLLLLK